MQILSWAFLAVTAVRTAVAIDMSLYQAPGKVETGFQNFLKELYAETEAPASTTTFTDFFAPNGSLIVMTERAVGAEQIVALKQALMPTDGSKQWNHVPNVTTVAAETASSRTYDVQGVIQTTFDGGNCSQAYYSTRFTVAKGEDGKVILALRSGSLITYDDYVVSPLVSPTDIACQSLEKNRSRREEL